MGWIIGRGIGVPFRLGSSGLGSSYWTTYLYNEADLGFRASGRDELTIPATVGTSPTITLPSFYKRDISVHALITDNGALDIGGTDFTLCGWIKGYTKTSLLFLLGKNIAGNVVGRYGFGYDITTGNLWCTAQPTGGQVSIGSSIDVTSGWHYLLMDINQTTHKLRFFIDNVQIGADVSFTGTFTALIDAYKFYFGSGNASGGGTNALTGSASFADCAVYNRLLLPAEQTLLFNRGFISGAKAFFPCSNADSGYIFDTSGNNYHATIVNTGSEPTLEKYDSYGSRYLLDKGYTSYINSLGTVIYVPNQFDGTEVTTIPTLTGFQRDNNHAGNLSNHNGANSYIVMDGSDWDRTDLTKFYLDAREIKYDSTIPKAWHISELYQYTFNNWSTEGRKGLKFVKRSVGIELIGYTTNNTGDNYKKVLQYLGLNNNNFITTWYTENAGSATKTIVIPTTGAGYSAFINWGDGSAEEAVTGTPGNITHLYSTVGVKTITIRGTFPRIYFNNGGDKLKLISINNWGNISWSSMAGAFYGCVNLKGKYVDYPTTTAMTSMANMFDGCTVFNSPVNFNTALVTVMTSAFSNCPIFNQAVNFNTALVTSMVNMFYNNSRFNQNISVFDVSNVTSMSGFLYRALDFSTANYDAALIAWSALSIQPNVVLNVPESHYSSGAAATARGVLIGAPNTWTITDGGLKLDNGKLIITLDDGKESCFTVAYPLFVSKGVNATFYVTTGLVGTATYVSWANLQAMAAAGMDIQCHTTTATSLTTLSEAQIDTDLDAVNDAFVANSLPSPRHLAYPSGYYNDNVKAYVADWRDTGRTVNWGYVLKGSDKFALNCNYTEAQGVLNVRVEKAKVMLDNAKADCKAVMLLGHGIGATSQISSAEYGEIIDYALSIGIDVITIAELYALL